MKVEVLISTVNNDDVLKLLKNMNIQTDAIVVNQGNKEESSYEIEFKQNRIKVYNTSSKGVSASRNIALANATADFVIIADDNEILVDGYEELVVNQYCKNKADIICFKIVRENDERKVKKTLRKIGYINAMRISSPQITLNLKSVNKYMIKFDESFGTGSKYSLGEETIFLYECIKNNFKIISCKFIIATKNNSRKSTWYKGIDNDYLLSRGASFYKMSPNLYKLNILQFALRKKNEYIKNDITIKQAIKYMLNGANEYKEYLGGNK